MSQSHAPTPWTQYQLGPTIYGADGFYVGITQGTNAKDDAALIVAAVNAYDSSQAEIEMLREALEAVRKEARKGKPDPDKIYGFANAALEPKP